MNEERVDILLATYNSNIKYLKQQIDSLLGQTYKNIKIYISDDASTDRSVIEVLEKYQKQDNRVVLFSQKQNIGFNENFIFLLKQSEADYIMFCDHDDIWYKDKVEKSLEKIKSSDASMVYTNARQVDENGKTIKENYFKYKNVPIVKGKSSLAISRCIGIGCSQIITKEVKDKMLSVKGKMVAHDWLAAFIANEQKGIDYIYNAMFDYRLHSNNVFGGRNLNQNLNRWKSKNGKNYKAFKKYREEVINKAYLGGAEMCLEYATIQSDKEFIKKLIKYYEKIKETKIINLHLIAYFKFLGGKNLLKKMCKEIVIFHFPLISFLLYKML